MKRIALVAVTVVGLYLTGRAVAELVLIHWGNPARYRNDWGGPSLAGVLAVRCLPGLILPGYLAWRISRSPAVDDPGAGSRRALTGQ
jgi:hypothetical protein